MSSRQQPDFPGEISNAPAASESSLELQQSRARLEESSEASARQADALREAERALASATGQLAAYEQILQAKDVQLAQKDHAIQLLRIQVQQLENRWLSFERTPGGILVRKLQNLRAWIAPPASSRDQMLSSMWRATQARSRRELSDSVGGFTHELRQQAKVLMGRGLRQSRFPANGAQTLDVLAVEAREPLEAHGTPVDIIVCVHDALEEVRVCLASVVAHTSAPYHLILVDDGSLPPTRDFLRDFARSHDATLLRSEEATGYTRAANRGLRASSSDLVMLLNSDTIATPEWLDRMVACIESAPDIGLVGPLSNTASWQSVPELQEGGDWAANPLPVGVNAGEMGQLVASYSARLFPEMAFLNGFCLMLRRAVSSQIGLLDEENFSPAFGEEDDYLLRARAAGWRAALADDAYVYHAQSRSYSDAKRQQLAKKAQATLARKHGERTIRAGADSCRNDRLLAGIRARSRAMVEREEWIRRGKLRFPGRRVLIVLPVNQPGGGANVVLYEAQAMRKMGVDVMIYNVFGHRANFEMSYPELDVPVLYGTREQFPSVAQTFDAMVATTNTSVEWLVDGLPASGAPRRGYYVQDFEPYLYPMKSAAYRRALASYTLTPDLRCFTKTEWTRREVFDHTQVSCALVGVSVDIDLFRPRPRLEPGGPEQPLRIAAMVRPGAPYRQPQMTTEILRQAALTYGDRVDLRFFGARPDDPGLHELPLDFAWKSAGVLPARKVARFLNEADIFLDLSSHQAMGLTALEAMACGAAVVAPTTGGATSFAIHEVNSLVVDTSSAVACWKAVQRLIEDRDLREHLQAQALVDVCAYYPEKPAYAILDTLFDRGTISGADGNRE